MHVRAGSALGTLYRVTHSVWILSGALAMTPAPARGTKVKRSKGVCIHCRIFSPAVASARGGSIREVSVGNFETGRSPDAPDVLASAQGSLDRVETTRGKARVAARSAGRNPVVLIVCMVDCIAIRLIFNFNRGSILLGSFLSDDAMVDARARQMRLHAQCRGAGRRGGARARSTAFAQRSVFVACSAAPSSSSEPSSSESSQLPGPIDDGFRLGITRGSRLKYTDSDLRPFALRR